MKIDSSEVSLFGGREMRLSSDVGLLLLLGAPLSDFLRGSMKGSAYEAIL